LFRNLYISPKFVDLNKVFLKDLKSVLYLLIKLN
jgi:hypothetical protein